MRVERELGLYSEFSKGFHWMELLSPSSPFRPLKFFRQLFSGKLTPSGLQNSYIFGYTLEKA
jgi:hypothetical protein